MSVIKHKNQRVGIFIDTQNLYHCAKNIYNAKVNFGEVVKSGLGERQLTRAIAYVTTTESGDEKNFFDALIKMGIETKTKNLQVFAGGSKKANWDIDLALDAIKMSPKLDSIILVTADGDFVPVVEYLQNVGCQVEVMSFGKATSAKLIEAADDFIDLDETPEKYLIGFRGRGDKRPRRAPRVIQEI